VSLWEIHEAQEFDQNLHVLWIDVHQAQCSAPTGSCVGIHFYFVYCLYFFCSYFLSLYRVTKWKKTLWNLRWTTIFCFRYVHVGGFSVSFSVTVESSLFTPQG
jgi:hypothetical protein